MKGKMKKLFALALAAIMVLAMGMTAFAQDVATGKNGTATITILNPKVGKTYTLYKVFSATETGSGDELKIAYSLLNGQVQGDLNGTGFSADANGNVTAPDNMTLSSANIEALTALAKNKGEQIGDTVTSDGTELNFTGLQYGYYLIESSAGAMVSINSTTPNMVIYDKNPSAPTIPDNGGKKVDSSNSVAIGDTVSYTLTFATTNYETTTETDSQTGAVTVNNTKILQYQIEDTLPAWLGNPAIDSVSVSWPVTNGDGTSIHKETVDITGNTFATTKKLTIPWVDSNNNHIYPDGAILEVKYHATVLSTVEVADKNTNTVKLTWTGNSTGLTDTEDIYTGSITVLKYAINRNDANDQSVVLPNAKFVILNKPVGADGTVPNDAMYYTVGSDGKIGETSNLEDATVLTTGNKLCRK